MRWRFLLRPGWLALIVVSVCFSFSAFTLLAPWQFRRDQEQSAQNAAITRSFTTQPRPLREVLARGADPGGTQAWRPVSLTGRYVPGGELVARLRTVQGEPAYEVLVPLRLDDGSTVLVDRGYVSPAEGVRVPRYPPVPSGEVTVVGRLQPDEPGEHPGEVIRQDGHRQVYSINSHTVSVAIGQRVEPGYVQLVDGAPGVLSALPLPQLDSGPFFSYALQWLAFGTMVPLGLGYFMWREATDPLGPADPRDPRDSDEPEDPHDPDDPHDPPEPQSALAARYGRV